MTAAPDEPEPTAPRRPRAPLWWRRFRLLPRTLQWTAYAAVVLVLVLVAGAVTATVVVRRSFPQTDGELVLPGLAAPVEVVRDEHGVPQVYADTTEDLMRAQGFVHAQERFFEMDVRRHATAGRLAELFGEEAVASDVYVRTLGWRRVAEAELPLLDPATRIALDAYAAGVNAYLDDRPASRIALEYAVLDASGADEPPEPWTAVDSLAWLKSVAWDLRANTDDEIGRTLAASAVGEQRAEQLWPAYPRRQHEPVVDGGAVVDGVFDQDAEPGDTRNPVRPAPFGEGPGAEQALDALDRVAAATDRLPAWLGRGDGLGSNAWVVSGEHTDTGAPLLADDPHLGVGLPGVWMQVGLHCRTVSDACPYDVAGFSYAGLPGVVVGHNADIAWGFTNLGADTTDLFLERVVGDRWQHDGRLRPLRTREETVEVAGGDDVTFEVRSTDHGPVLSDVDDVIADVAGAADASRTGGPDDATYAVSVSWTGFEPAPTADAVLALGRASDWTTFRAAVADLAAPAQNVVYADRDGHIGYQAAGRVPIRKSGNDGLLPAAGWRAENDWTGESVPFDGLPSVLDPDEGFVVSANQAVIGPAYAYDLGRDWDRGYRSDRIRDLLEAQLADGGTVSADDVLAAQLDTHSAVADVLFPYLLSTPLDPGYDDDGQELLFSWDRTQPAEGDGSAAAAYVNAVWRRLLELTFHDELPERLWPDGGQRWVAVVDRLLARPDDPWWDDTATEEVEQRDDVVLEAMTTARDDLTRAISPDAAEWTWGALHRLEQPGAFGRSGDSRLAGLFDRGGWEVGGAGTSVAAFAWDARAGFEVTTAPSMRMVVSLADLDDSRWVALGGVSGHAFHPHYTDQTDLLVRGETLPWAFTRDAVTAAGEDVLTLVPAGE